MERAMLFHLWRVKYKPGGQRFRFAFAVPVTWNCGRLLFAFSYPEISESTCYGRGYLHQSEEQRLKS